MSKPLLTYQFEDDGMYNNQWRIYDQPLASGLDPQFYADADSEETAKEIFDAVNAMRTRGELPSHPEPLGTPGVEIGR